MDFVRISVNRSALSFLTPLFIQFGEEDDMGPGGPGGLFAQIAQYGVTCALHKEST
jgi:hypothetical protein